MARKRALATHPQKSVLEPPALQVGFELLLDVRGQRLSLFGKMLDESGVVLLHQPVEPRVLGPVALVAESTSGFPAVGMHRLRVLAQAGGGSVWAYCLRPCKDLACHASGSGCNITTYNTSSDDISLTYDARNNVTDIKVVDSNAATKARDKFWYDPDGRRYLRRSTWRAATSLDHPTVTLYMGDYPATHTISSACK